VLGLACAGSPTRETPVELSFWAGPGAGASEHGARLHEDHPCGSTLTVPVTRIPPADDPVLEPDRIYEIDAGGSVLLAWTAPIDARVVGVRGGAVLLGHGVDSALEIETDGTFRLTARPPGKGRPFDCPDTALFEPSEFERCATFVDPDSGAPRRILYQGPCT
jgi:hypothetical protein